MYAGLLPNPFASFCNAFFRIGLNSSQFIFLSSLSRLYASLLNTFSHSSSSNNPLSFFLSFSLLFFFFKRFLEVLLTWNIIMPFIRYAFVRLKARIYRTDTFKSRPSSTSRLPSDIVARIRTSSFYPSMPLFRSANAVHRCTQLFILNILFSVIHRFFLITFFPVLWQVAVP